jgi:hypothetical protein
MSASCVMSGVNGTAIASGSSVWRKCAPTSFSNFSRSTQNGSESSIRSRIRFGVSLFMTLLWVAEQRTDWKNGT